METVKTLISERLKEFRKYKKLSGEDFGAILNLKKGAVSHIENGRANPSVDHLEILANHFPELNIEWLVSGKGEMIKDPVIFLSEEESNCRDLLELEKEQHGQLKERFAELRAQLRKEKSENQE